ncbi:hypothetical protein FOH38_11160 [Lysinibacillus fusiformis]|nr:hypothetical protein FOH38_11160 [Lysinibacillus fusiformis]
MCMNNSMNHCGCGCSSKHNNECNALGPFIAVDAACIQPPPPNTARGSIIAFSSGITTVELATVLNGAISVPSLIGFGSATPGVVIAGTTIDLSAIVTEAFAVPRAGNITAISASFNAFVTAGIVGSTTIRAQIYRAPAGSNMYTATNAFVDLAPAITGPISLGETAFNSADVSPVPVAVGDKLLMVYSIVATSGITVAQTITGTASAGITID